MTTGDGCNKFILSHVGGDRCNNIILSYIRGDRFNRNILSPVGIDRCNKIILSHVDRSNKKSVYLCERQEKGLNLSYSTYYTTTCLVYNFTEVTPKYAFYIIS